MAKKFVHMINGNFVEEKNLLISAHDLGFLRGFAVFDFLVTYKNQAFMIDDHINRFFNSASSINLFNPWTKNQIKNMITSVLNANKTTDEKIIKIVLTGGESVDGFTPENKTNLLILIDKWQKSPSSVYKKGVQIITGRHKRYLPECKTNGYIEAIRNIDRMKESKAFEILYFDEIQVYECSRSNIFALINGKILTPKDHVLKGITGKVVLEKLKLKVPVLEQNFRLDDLFQAQEVFITKSNDEIVPIIKIDHHIIENGKVGEITKSVMKEFSKFTKSGGWN